MPRSLASPSCATARARAAKRWSSWLLKPNPGRVPWWIFAKTRRVPETRAADYPKIARLLWAGGDATVEAALDPKNLLYRRLWRPLPLGRTLGITLTLANFLRSSMSSSSNLK